MRKVLAGFVLVTALHSQARRPAIEAEICSVVLSLGMTKAAAAEKLVGKCEILLDSNDRWWLKSGDQIDFEGGRVSALRRSWTPLKGFSDSVDVVRNLVSATQNALGGRDSAAATLNVDVKRSPNSTTYRLFLSLPNNKEVSVILIEDHSKPTGGTLLDISESVVR